MRKFVLLALCTLSLLACKKNIFESAKVYVVTGEADILSSTAANLIFYIYPDSSMKNIEKGVICSTDPKFPEGSYWGYVGYTEDTPRYMYYMNMLQSSTKYYYKAFLFCENEKGEAVKYFGEVKSFTTPPAV